MTKAQFIAAVEAKPNFIKWVDIEGKPGVQEEVLSLGGVDKVHRMAYITTPDGSNNFNVWFMVDTETGEAKWQQQDTLQPDTNALNTKMKALTNYLKSTFFAYFVTRYDLDNNWAEADAFTISGQDLAKSKVLVYKQGASPITHKIIL